MPLARSPTIHSDIGSPISNMEFCYFLTGVQTSFLKIRTCSVRFRTCSEYVGLCAEICSDFDQNPEMVVHIIGNRGGHVFRDMENRYRMSLS